MLRRGAAGATPSHGNRCAARYRFQDAEASVVAQGLATFV
jgi:hypothetical protein